MIKKEAIWREILVQARVNKKTIFTQKELAETFSFSTSTVFNALKVPRKANIISVSGRNFRLESYEKLLRLWASHRSPAKDIFFQTELKESAKIVESMMPPEAKFGLYSAARLDLDLEPADYDHVYIYLDPPKLSGTVGRFPKRDERSNHPNFFVLQPDHCLTKYPEMPIEQIFVDIWNAPEWYAKDFLKALEERLPL